MQRTRERLVYEVSRLKEHGQSIRGIARALDIDRKTVRRVLSDLSKRREEGDSPTNLKAERAPRLSKLDPYSSFIQKTLEEFPDILATRLYEELQSQGFDGSYTIVRDYLKRQRPKPKKKLFMEVKTPPGHQAQADWSPYKIESGETLHAFSCVLSFSRYQYLHFCPDEQQLTLFRELRKAFEAWEGVPSEIVFDNMRAVVSHWDHGEPILNLKMLDFASFYGFQIHLAPPRRGDYKGKVERPFRFVESSILNGRHFHSIKDANSFLENWLELRCNSRVHGTLKRRPMDLLQEERPQLRPLPHKPYDDRELAYRLVDPYGLIHFAGNLYSVGNLVGEWVYVRAGEDLVQIYDAKARLLAKHQRLAAGAHETSQLPEHTPKRRNRVSLARILQRFEAWGEKALAFAKEVKSRAGYAGVQLGNILDLQQSYTIEDILAAMDHAAKYGAYNSHSVEKILLVRAKPRTLQDILAGRAFEAISKTLSSANVPQRSLEAYGQLLSPNANNQEVTCHGEEKPT